MRRARGINAQVAVDGVLTDAQVRYFYASPGNPAMEIERLPELPPLLRFEPEGQVIALLAGESTELQPEEARAFNIYRLFDPRTVKSGLAGEHEYLEQRYTFASYVDIKRSMQAERFQIDEALFAWLARFDRIVQPVEFLLEGNTIRRMTLSELPPGEQRITLIFSY